MQQRRVLWVSTDVEVDSDAFHDLHDNLLLLKDGWDEVVARLREIKGVPVLVEGLSRYGSAEIKTTDELISITEEEAPEGLYDPPQACSPQAREAEPAAEPDEGAVQEN